MADASVSFGPYVFTLQPAEIDGIAARYGLRTALGGGLTASHHAPLAAFVLTLLFAAILATTGLISKRAGEIAFLVAALAFMIQRLLTHRRIWRTQSAGRAEVERLFDSRSVTMTIEDSGLRESGGAAPRELLLADCQEAEESGGLVYVWGRDGAPFVLPDRVLAEGEAARIVARLKPRARRART